MKTLYKNIITCAIVTLSFMSFAQNGVGINTSVPKSDFEVNGSQGQKVTIITATTTLDDTHNVIVCENMGGAISVNLPDATTCTGRVYTIKKADHMASMHNVTIDGNGAQTIDGTTTVVLNMAQQSTTIISDGANWRRLSTNTTADNIMFPMGEISFFSAAGSTITISATSDGTSNMVLCNPTSTLSNTFATVMEFDNGGANTGRLRYTGTESKTFHVACTISFQTGGAGNQYIFALARNGTIIPESRAIQKFGNSGDIQSTALHQMVTLASGEYLELYVGNMTTNNNIKIHSMNLFAMGMAH